jgi:hypothetical protein
VCELSSPCVSAPWLHVGGCLNTFLTPFKNKADSTLSISLSYIAVFFFYAALLVKLRKARPTPACDGTVRRHRQFQTDTDTRLVAPVYLMALALAKLQLPPYLPTTLARSPPGTPYARSRRRRIWCFRRRRFGRFRTTGPAPRRGARSARRRRRRGSSRPSPTCR